MNNIYNIYLYGIEGLYNYGCEAMVRSISKQVAEIFPKSNIVYMSYRVDDDKARLTGCSTVKVQAIESKYSKLHEYNIVGRCINGLKRKIGLASDKDLLGIKSDWTKKCDLLIIIGGDVFDLLPPQSRTRKYSNDRIYVSNLVKKNGGKVILWGISFGNFDECKQAKKAILSYLKNTVDYGFIRDKKSYEYLMENGITHIQLCSDPAFYLRTIQTIQCKKKALGINLSPLSNKYLKVSHDINEWVEIWTKIIERIVKELAYEEVYLIPHVVNIDYPKDDDYQYLYRIKEKLENKISINLVSKNLGYLSIKQFLSKCDLIFAARMHCAVNAITCGVPTVFLSYSLKSKGMCRHVYGSNWEMLIDMNDMIDSIDLEKVRNICAQTDEIRAYLALRNVELMKDASSPQVWLMKHYGM